MADGYGIDNDIGIGVGFGIGVDFELVHSLYIAAGDHPIPLPWWERQGEGDKIENIPL